MKTRTKRTHRRQNTKKRGGNSYPPSAWGWQTANLGSGWDQFMNTFSIKPADNLGTVNSNEIVPVGRPNAEDSQPMLGPNMKNQTQKGGKKKHRRGKGTRHKRGGNGLLGAVSKAIVPATLFAMQRRAVHKKKSKK